MADHDRISALCARLRDLPQVRAASLEYPPATPEQIEQTEEQLGFALPPFQRAVYTEIANGGVRVGPGIMLYGAEGGCPKPYGRHVTVGHLVSRARWRMHDRVIAALARNPGRTVISDEAPNGFVEIGDWGCGTNVELDSHTGGVYLTGYGGEIWLDGNEAIWLTTSEWVAPSLEDLFERWLDGGYEALVHSCGRLPPDMIDLTDIADENEVWSGLYRFGPDWDAEPEDTPEDDFDVPF